jgi:uncharacterized membrane protein YphA (DoxX/SURF4 family)
MEKSQPKSSLIRRFDEHLTKWMADHSILFLRIAVGIIFLWFGVLKFFTNLSPAEDLAGRTITVLSANLIPSHISLPILATWECLIGIGLLTGKFLRATLALLFLQMLGTIMPLFFFPEETFTHFPYAPTLEGQYIIKNLIIIAAAIFLGATVRGGAVIADPVIAEEAKREEEAIEEK